MGLKLDLEFVTDYHCVANTSMIRSGNIGAILLRNFACIIDTTSYTTTAKSFRKQVEKNFGLPVKFLIYTHYHGDHIFGASAFRDLAIISSKQTLLNLTNIETLKSIEEWKSNLINEDPLAKGIEIITPTVSFVNKIFIEDEDLEIEICHAGGHTSGSTYVYFPKEKVIFTGDLIFEDIYPYAGDSTCNPDMWIAQLEQIQKMEIERIVPGHGHILLSKRELDKHIDFYKSLQARIREAIQENLSMSTIKAPEFFELEAEIWKPVAVESWYNFYKDQI
ncbi:MAG: MBL fold metallo-hydrolase [Candidatus Hodarchaeales archaeon]|jgi:glyoxylase-like metal-dependent hydrolase (beta-lactamase superfamily II)